MGVVHLPDLVSLRLLTEVGVCQSLGKSASTMGMSQPAASKRISRLERELGLKLVERGPNGSRLTTEGEAVANWATRILDSVDHLLGAVASLRAASASDLRIAASMTIAEHLVPRWLAELRDVHPEVHVGLLVANSEEVGHHVLKGRADVGFIEGPDTVRGLARRRVGQDRLVVVVDPRHPWASRRSVRRSELLQTPLVVREKGSGTRATLDRALGGAHSAPPLLELGSNEAVKGAVAEGAGPAVISVLAVRRDIEAGRLVEVVVRGLDLSRDLNAVWPTKSNLSPAAVWLLRQAASTSHGRRPMTASGLQAL